MGDFSFSLLFAPQYFIFLLKPFCRSHEDRWKTNAFWLYIRLQYLSRTKSHHLFKILFWRIVSPDFCLNDSLELRMIIIVYFYSSMGAWYPWKFWKQWQLAPQGLRKNKQTKNRENLEKRWHVLFFVWLFCFYNMELL